MLLRAWSTAAAGRSVSLLLLGEGPEEAALRSIAGPGVTFTGRVEDIAPYLKAADLFVLPSATEGLSNALLEALAAGLAVVATDVGGARDVVEDTVGGRLVPPNDAEALAEALAALLEGTALRAAYGRAGRERVVDEYSLVSVADRLAALYRQLAAHQGIAGRLQETRL